MIFKLKTMFVVLLVLNCSFARKSSLESISKGPRKQSSILSSVAKELLHKTSSTSQLLSLNMTNMLLLLVLKVIVLGTEFLENNNTPVRATTEENPLTDEEAALALSFLIGESCLYRAACEVPKTAKKYLEAAEILRQGVTLLSPSTIVDKKYDNVIAETRKAIDYGSRNWCPSEYKCKRESIEKLLRAI